MTQRAQIRERPILFSGAMVRAILEGRKTQTRRVVRFKDVNDDHDCHHVWKCWQGGNGPIPKGINELEWQDLDEIIRCPYGVPGDRLWVRETWQEIAHPDFNAFPCDHVTIYRADGEKQIIDGHKAEIGPWKPSIFMPYPRSRISLEIADVRVERLQEISEGDVVAEGLDEALVQACILGSVRRIKDTALYWINGCDDGNSWCLKCGNKEVERLKKEEPSEDHFLDGGWFGEEDSQQFCNGCGRTLICAFTDYCIGTECDHFEDVGFDPRCPGSAYSLQSMLDSGGWESPEHATRVRRLGFRAVWDSINAKRAPWSSNPWVWVVTFKRLEGEQHGVAVSRE